MKSEVKFAGFGGQGILLIGNVKSANIVALSAFVARSNIVDFGLLRKSVIAEFSEKEDLIPLNITALEEGWQIALE